MPSIAVVHGTGAYAHAAHPFSLHVNGVDLILQTQGMGGRTLGVPLESISVSEVGGNAQSTMDFLYLDPAAAFALPALSPVLFNDHAVAAASSPMFAGYVIGRNTVPHPSGQGYAVQVHCVDYSYLLDMCIMPALKTKAGDSDKTLIQSVVAHSLRHAFIHTHHGLIVSTNASMPAMDFTHLTLRAAIEAIQSNAGENRHYYVDFLHRLHYFSGATESGMGSAPFVITDNPSGGQRAATDLQLEYDDSQMCNAVYIAGHTRDGSGWVKDEISVKRYGLREAFFEAVHSTTTARMNNIGQHFLAQHKDPIVRGSFTYVSTDTGWRVGQTVTITNAALGLSSATYPIKQLDTTFLTGSGIREYTIHFGELQSSGRRRSTTPSLGPLPVTAGPPPHHAPRPVAHHHSGAGAHPRNRRVN